MAASNYCDYNEAYKHYLESNNISVTCALFKKRRSVMKREFLKLGFEYPVKAEKKWGYEINRPPKKEFNLDIDYFKVIDTPTKAYFLGLIYADGCVYTKKDKKNGNSYSFRISLNEDDGYLIEYLRKELGIKETKKLIYEGSFMNSVNGKKYPRRNMESLAVYRKDFIKNLIDKGVYPNKTYKELSLPNINFISDFIRGYFDGDGCIGVYKTKTNNYITHCFFTSKTRKLLDEIKEYIGRDVDCYVIKVKEIFLLRIRHSSVLKFWDIIKPKNNVITMKRKKDKFEFYRSFLEQSKNEKSDELLENPEMDNQQPS